MLLEKSSSTQSPVVCVELEHPLGVLLFLVVSLFHSVWASGIRTGGGTLSAPTGCSPRDHGRLLAVDWGLSSSFFSFYSLHSTQADRSSRIRTGGGMPSAPTGCSPRDRSRLLAVNWGLSSTFLSFLPLDLGGPVELGLNQRGHAKCTSWV